MEDGPVLSHEETGSQRSRHFTLNGPSFNIIPDLTSAPDYLISGIINTTTIGIRNQRTQDGPEGTLRDSSFGTSSLILVSDVETFLCRDVQVGRAGAEEPRLRARVPPLPPALDSPSASTRPARRFQGRELVTVRTPSPARVDGRTGLRANAGDHRFMLSGAPERVVVGQTRSGDRRRVHLDPPRSRWGMERTRGKRIGPSA